MRRLRGQRPDLRFDTVMVGARGRDLLFVGERSDRERTGERFFGEAGLRCTRPIGIRTMSIVIAVPRTIGTVAVSCPAPDPAVPPQEAMVVCTRGGRW